MAFNNAEKTRNASDATRGWRSRRDLRRTDVSVGSDRLNTAGAWVERKRARNERHVKCNVDVVVVGD